jgi:hypothetical protein
MNLSCNYSCIFANLSCSGIPNVTCARNSPTENKIRVIVSHCLSQVPGNPQLIIKNPDDHAHFFDVKPDSPFKTAIDSSGSRPTPRNVINLISLSDPLPERC